MNSIAKPEKRPVNGTATPSDNGYVSPRVNITETKEGYILEAEMPGVNKSGLEILLEGNELTLVGKRQSAPINAEVIYSESTKRNYRRAFVLDPTLDTEKIEARIENGVLRLELPKAERVRPRKVTVTD